VVKNILKYLLDPFHDVSKLIRYCRFHIYADDLQTYHTYAVSDFLRCIDELNLDLQRLQEWS
jgi:hypothetical protein